MDNEVWKPVVGLEDYYEVSNFGRVRAIERIISVGNGNRVVKPKIKNTYISKVGYPSVTLCVNKNSRCYSIHRLVAMAFIPNPENKPCIDHINTIKTDNRIENLRWCTHKENSNNEITLKRVIEKSKSKEAMRKSLETKRENGSNTAPKYVYQFDKNGKFIKRYDSIMDASRQNGIRNSLISCCCRGEKLSSHGYIWSYEMEGNHEYVKPIRKDCKAVLQYSINGEFIKEWVSLHEASRAYNWFPANLSQSIKKGMTRGGYIWKFKNKDD